MTPGNGYEGAKIANDGSRNSVARRYVLIGVAALGAVVLVVSIWIVVDVLRVRAALDDARIQASDLTEQLKTVGPGGELAIASQLENDITHARSIADGPMWSFSMHLPIFGGDFTVISQALDAVEPVASNGLPALVQLSEDRDNGELGIKDGQIDLSVIRKLTPTLEHSSAVFTQARKQFSAIDLRAAHGFVQSAISEVGSKLDQAQAILSKGADAARLAPGMLGADGPRNYLMVFQNNAEIRSTGGIPGAYAEVEAKDGTLIIKRQGEGGGTGYFFPPALALTKQERALYGTLPANFWVDSNFTPNFPRTAEILRAMYRRKFGTHLDGVISVDPVALARVLQATGPVQVTKDIALSSQNVIPVLLNLIYTKYTHSDAEQNAFFAQAAKKIFKAFITGGGADPGDLIKEIQASIEESRIIVNATRPELYPRQGPDLPSQHHDAVGRSKTGHRTRAGRRRRCPRSRGRPHGDGADLLRPAGWPSDRDQRRRQTADSERCHLRRPFAGDGADRHRPRCNPSDPRHDHLGIGSAESRPLPHHPGRRDHAERHRYPQRLLRPGATGCGSPVRRQSSFHRGRSRLLVADPTLAEVLARPVRRPGTVVEL
jgi:hypothetical protein